MAILRIPARPAPAAPRLAPLPASPRTLFARFRGALRDEVNPAPALIVAALISGLGLASTAFVPETAAREHTTAENIASGLFVAAFAIGAFATWVGCGTGHRWGLFAALPVSLVMLLSALTCPLSGHHTFGTWVLGSSGLAAGALLLNIAAIRYVRPLPRE